MNTLTFFTFKTLIGLLAVLYFATLPFISQAASISTSADKSVYEIGDTVAITVSVNPDGEDIIVARSEISYSADILSYSHFSLGSALPYQSPGTVIGDSSLSIGSYNLTTGVETSTMLMTVFFEAEACGNAIISVNGGSLLIDTDQINHFDSGGQVTVQICDEVDTPVSEEDDPSGTETTDPDPEVEDGDDVPTEEVATQISTPIISSPTHPESENWYSDRTVQLEWAALDVDRYVYTLGKDHDAIPLDEVISAELFNIDLLDEGIWYFALRGIIGQDYTNIGRYTLKVDQTPPDSFDLFFESHTNAWGQKVYEIYFAAFDELSGIDSYRIYFDDNADEAISVESPYKMNASDLQRNSVTIVAVDKAGNETLSTLLLGSDEIQSQVDAMPYRGAFADFSKARLAIPIIAGIVGLWAILRILLRMLRQKRR